MDRAASSRNVRLNGLVTKMENDPPERIMELRKLVSTSSPSTTPRMMGTTGNPSFRSRNEPMPMHTASSTWNVLLSREYVPAMQ